MRTSPLLHSVDAVTIPVPDLDAGLDFYQNSLGHRLLWRNDAIGQAGLGLAGSDTEIVLTTRQRYEPDWLVASLDEAIAAVRAGAGTVLDGPFDIPVGRAVVLQDPFGNALVLVELSRGRYVTTADGRVVGVRKSPDT
jgi:predicted enzyme related to lactoylglutathione lyase